MLKEATAIITVGVGIPKLDGGSPLFHWKTDASYLSLTKRDIDDDVMSFFRKISDTQEDSKLSGAVEWLLAFTGGHTFPFLKFAELVLTNRGDGCILDVAQIEMIVLKNIFDRSNLYVDIESRCFQLSAEALESAGRVMNGFRSIFDEDRLNEIGLWNKSKISLASSFFMTHLFQQ